MPTIQNIQVSSFLDEAALLKIIDTIQSLLSMFLEQLNNDMKVLILVGVTGSGKSTIFNLLGGAKFKLIESEDGVEELELEEISQEFSAMKGGMQSVTKEPKYYFNEEFNHLLIDFPGFQDTNGEFDQIMIQMLFYKISTMSKVKILYVVRHPELEFQERGTNLQEFIRTTFKEQSIGIENLTLVLNAFNDEGYSNEDVKTSAREQMQQQYNSDCNNLNLIVLRKINEQDDIAKLFSEENRRKIWEDIIASKEISFEPIQIIHTEKISAYLSGKSFSYIEGVCSSIFINLNQNLQKTQIKEIQRLKNLIYMFQELPPRKITDFVQWFEQFANISANIAQELNCLEEVIQKSEEFLKIYLFFSQFSNFINGYSECMKNGDFAFTQYLDMIKIINNKINYLKEKQKVEKTTAEKNQEILLKENAMSRAEEQRQLKEKYTLQQSRLRTENDELQYKVQQQKNEKKKLQHTTASIRSDYYQLEYQSKQTQKNLNYQISQERQSQKEIEQRMEQKRSELNILKRKQAGCCNDIQQELYQQERKKAQVQEKIQQKQAQSKEYEQHLRSLQSKNSDLQSEIQDRKETMNRLRNQIYIGQQNNDGCQLI